MKAQMAFHIFDNKRDTNPRGCPAYIYDYFAKSVVININNYY